MLALLASTLTARDDRALRGMSAVRLDKFVDLVKWNLPIADGEFGIDQFDNQRPHCPSLLSDADRHFASALPQRASQSHTFG